MKYNFVTYTGTIPTNVQVDQIDATSSHPAAIRAHYTSGGTVVRVQAAGPSLSGLRGSFDQILAAQLKVLPADG